MGNRKAWKQGIALTILLLTLSLTGVGCGDGRQTKEPDILQAERTELVSKTGTLSYGYFYEEEGIVLSAREHFMYSDWEPMEFDYICMNPTCSHLTGSCSARTLSNDSNAGGDFSVIYQDHLIVVHPYSRLVINESSDTVQDWSYVYQTDVYEADLDGNNRRKVATFSGSLSTPVVTHAAVLMDGKLYFGGPMEERSITEQGAQGVRLMTKSLISDAVYCFDLKDYTIETLAVTENKQGVSAYQYQFYEYDGMIYAIISNFQEDCAVWYRIVPRTGVCEEVMRFDSNVARFTGAIGNTVYYSYENSGETLYAKELTAGAKEREIMSIAGEDVSAFILDGQILFMTDQRTEGEDRMTEYAVLDPDGNILDMIRYDDYITMLDVVGDKLIYFRVFSDCEEWWADKDDLKNLTLKGVQIGPFFGWKLDTLVD